jgi:hypothetical protein
MAHIIDAANPVPTHLLSPHLIAVANAGQLRAIAAAQGGSIAQSCPAAMKPAMIGALLVCARNVAIDKIAAAAAAAVVAGAAPPAPGAAQTIEAGLTEMAKFIGRRDTPGFNSEDFYEALRNPSGKLRKVTKSRLGRADPSMKYLQSQLKLPYAAGAFVVPPAVAAAFMSEQLFITLSDLLFVHLDEAAAVKGKKFEDKGLRDLMSQTPELSTVGALNRVMNRHKEKKRDEHKADKRARRSDVSSDSDSSSSSDSSASSGAARKKSRKDVECYKCGKKGHYKADCTSKSKSDKKSKTYKKDKKEKKDKKYR